MTAGKTACETIKPSISRSKAAPASGVTEAIGKLFGQKMPCNYLVARPDTVETDDKKRHPQ